MLGCVEEAIRETIEEGGTISTSLAQDICELISIAKEIEMEIGPDCKSKGFFAKVASVAESRFANSGFIDSLLAKLDSSILDMKSMVGQIVNILGTSNASLNEAFEEMSRGSPDFVRDVLK